MSEAQRRRFSREGEREKLSLSTIKRFKEHPIVRTKEWNEKQATSLRDHYKLYPMPIEQRKKMSASRREYLNEHPDYNKELSVKLKKVYDESLFLKQEIGQKVSLAMKKHYQDHPEARSKKRELFIKNVILTGKWGGTNLSTKRTKIEVTLEEVVREIGIPYVIQYVDGGASIDVAILQYKIALFADGCYWHGCPLHHPQRVEHSEVDKRVSKRLEKLGWHVIRLWEHDLVDKDYARKLLSSFLCLNPPIMSTLDKWV